MMNYKKKNLVVVFLILLSNVFSQSLVENDLTTNQVLVQHTSTRGTLKLGSITDTISFGSKGILEDFSYDSPYPDTAFWLDNYVFVNRDIAKAPVTLGVATFDGLNANGYPYNFAAGSGSSGLADYLTSKPIDLNYLPSDSIYFSFFYQPEGIGNYPEIADSLVLQFREPGASTSWKNVWAHKGENLASNDSSWKLVMIPITNVNYLKKGFQFRFKNYATLSGNVDHWSIDFVYLNKSRVNTDTLFEDVSFVYNTPSLLANYSAVPWRHYSASLMKTIYSTTIRNNFSVTKNGSFGYKIYDEAGVQQNTYTGNSFNIDPYFPNGYMNYAPFSAPPISYLIPSLTDTTFYTIESYLNSTPDFNRKNDTVRHQQNFSNFYAYDDGTAETSFGLSTLYGQMAEKFVITTADTLQAMDIYWNPVLQDVSQLYTFNLMIWNDNGGGFPGALIFMDTTAKPVYNQTGYDKFTRHYLQKGKIYLTPGTYHFGMRQNTNQFLNIGVDRNTNTQNKVFYNVIGSWTVSPYPGSLMLHPVFGATSEFVGIVDRPVLNNSITVFPNPAKDQLFIKGLSDNEVVTVSIIDLYGRLVKEVVEQSVESIDVSDLANGIYVLRIASKDFSHTNKFIISR